MRHFTAGAKIKIDPAAQELFDAGRRLTGRKRILGDVQTVLGECSRLDCDPVNYGDDIRLQHADLDAVRGKGVPAGERNRGNYEHTAPIYHRGVPLKSAAGV